MRTSFSPVLKAVAASAAVSGSVFASIWLLAIKPEGPQAPRAAAGASSTVVHASLPTKQTAVEHRTVLVRPALPPTFTHARVGLRPPGPRAHTTRNAVPRIPPVSGTLVTQPASPTPPAEPPPPTPAPNPTSPASTPAPTPPLAPTPTPAPAHDPVAPISGQPDGSGSGSAGPAVVTSAQTSTSAASKGGKRTGPAAPVTSRGGGKGKTTKPTGPKKAEDLPSGKQPDVTQPDSKQTDGKQSDGKPADDPNPSQGNGQSDKAKGHSTANGKGKGKDTP
jgi:hypothetical protein